MQGGGGVQHGRSGRGVVELTTGGVRDRVLEGDELEEEWGFAGRRRCSRGDRVMRSRRGRRGLGLVE